MWLGDMRVETLRAYMSGYEDAREDLGTVRMVQEDAQLLAEFAEWLARRTHWDGDPMGWEGHIRVIDGSSQNITTFFRLFEQFLETKGIALSSVQPSRLPRSQLLP